MGLLGPALVGLSVLDLVTTHRLLTRGRFVEANPVARWVFERGNIAGMTLFKFAMVGLILVLGEAIERRRPRLGRLVVLFGCVATAAVAAHGLRIEAE